MKVGNYFLFNLKSRSRIYILFNTYYFYLSKNHIVSFYILHLLSSINKSSFYHIWHEFYKKVCIVIIIQNQQWKDLDIADLFGVFASHFWAEKRSIYEWVWYVFGSRRGYAVDEAYISFVIPCNNNNENNNHNRLLVRYTPILLYICVCHLTIRSMVRFRCLNIWLLGKVHIHILRWWLLKNEK